MPSVSTHERRAGTAPARLFAFASLAVAFFLLLISAAHAAPPLAIPKLKATDPVSTAESPATTTTPLVFGEAEPEEGIIINVARSALAGAAIGRGVVVDHPTEHPDYEILIFKGAGCAGPVVGQGSAGDFESVGIQASADADAKTALSAWQVDPAEPSVHSACSESFFYWEGNVPPESDPGTGGGSGSGGGSTGPGQGQEGVGLGTPAGNAKPAPPRLHMSPRARANDNTPSVAGSALDGTSVLVFSGDSCAGAPVAKGSAAQLSAGLQVQVGDNTSTTFSAVAVAGQRSDCSAPVAYVEDSTPPRTRITMAPGAKTRKRKAVLRFADVSEDPPGTTFQCKVKAGKRAKWRPCSSPLRLRHLRPRRYVVRIRATDLAGNLETKAVKRSFKVVRHP